MTNHYITHKSKLLYFLIRSFSNNTWIIGKICIEFPYWVQRDRGNICFFSLMPSEDSY